MYIQTDSNGDGYMNVQTDTAVVTAGDRLPKAGTLSAGLRGGTAVT